MKINLKYKLVGFGAAAMMTTAASCEKCTHRYIVENKSNYKILIHGINNPLERRAICFLPDVAGHEQYTMIQPGDTLTCDGRVLDALVVPDRFNEENFTVKKLNGRTFQEIREQRMLDNVRRTIENQK